MFKKWKKAMISEIPKLVWNSNISSELKPEINFVEIVKTDGGFIAGESSQLQYRVSHDRKLRNAHTHTHTHTHL